MSNRLMRSGPDGVARRKAGWRAGMFAILGILGAGVAGCSTQQEIVRMPALTGLPIQPLALPEASLVLTSSQKDAAIADMQAAARKNDTLAN
ncbi:MAG: hypothetical protein ACC634_07445 [Hyphomicrobiales bacterium]